MRADIIKHFAKNKQKTCLESPKASILWWSLSECSSNASIIQVMKAKNILVWDCFFTFIKYDIVKATVRKFCLFVTISVWKPAIAAICGIIFLAWVVHRHGSSTDKSNVWLSVTAPVWILHFVFTDTTSWKYDPNKSFHWRMSSE